jgi:ParB family chromosome partitioning protein
MEDFGMTHGQIASAVGKSRSAVTNTLRLLQLPAAVQGVLESGAITAGHARALLPLEDHAFAAHLASKAAAEGWSVRNVEDAVRLRQRERAPSSPKGRAREPRPAAIIELENRLSDHLGSTVKIDYGPRGGRLTVRFGDLDDLEKIYKAFFGA